LGDKFQYPREVESKRERICSLLFLIAYLFIHMCIHYLGQLSPHPLLPLSAFLSFPDHELGLT
jgi:hypothetical protein